MVQWWTARHAKGRVDHRVEIALVVARIGDMLEGRGAWTTMVGEVGLLIG